MAVVRVIVWDEQNLLERVSSPEDTFLIETIDCSGSDANLLTIGNVSASAIFIGKSSINTYISGNLIGKTFISSTFYGDGSHLDGMFGRPNYLTSSVGEMDITNVNSQEVFFLSTSLSQSGKYHIQWSSEITNKSTNKDTFLKATINTFTLNEVSVRINLANYWQTQGATSFQDLISGSNVFRIYMSASSGATAKIRRMNAMIWKI